MNSEIQVGDLVPGPFPPREELGTRLVVNILTGARDLVPGPFPPREELGTRLVVNILTGFLLTSDLPCRRMPAL